MVVFKRSLAVLFVLLAAAGYNVQGLSNDYNPLNPAVYFGYKRESSWSLFLTAGPLSASTADFLKGTNKALCVRVLVFMAHGAVLDHVVTDCDAPDHYLGLATQDSTLRYFDTALVRQEAAGHYEVVKRSREEGKCINTVYVLEECNDQCPSPKVKNRVVSSDKSCKDLDGFNFPPMTLISSSGDVGKFKELSTEWMTYNPWHSLGFVSREYSYKSPSPCCYSVKCFRLVVVTSYGRAVHGIKLSCGPLHGITTTDTSLQLGDVMHVTMKAGSQDTFIVLLNAHNSYCIKKTISVTVEGGRITRKLIDSNSRLTRQDKDCESLVTGDVKDSTVERDTVDHLKTTPLKKFFNQEMLKPLEPNGELLDYNLARDMGMTVQTYTDENDKSLKNVVTLMARGVPVLPVLVGAGTHKRLIVRKDGVFYDRDVAFTKLYAEHAYQVLKRLDEGHCRRKLYDVRANGELEMAKDEKIDKYAPRIKMGTRTEAPTTKPEGNILDDSDCKNLIDGKHLKTNEALKFGDLTDETGVPKIFPSFNDE